MVAQHRHPVAEQVYVEASFDDVLAVLSLPAEQWVRPLAALALRATVPSSRSKGPGPVIGAAGHATVEWAELPFRWETTAPSFPHVEGRLIVRRHGDGTVIALEGMCLTGSPPSGSRVITEHPWEAAVRTLLGAMRSILEHAA